MPIQYVGRELDEPCHACQRRPAIAVRRCDTDTQKSRFVARACGVCFMKAVDLALGWGISAQVAQAYASSAAGRAVRRELARTRQRLSVHTPAT